MENYSYQIPSRTIHINNEDYLFFSGTGYLGIHANPHFGALVKQGIDLYGTNYGASRLGNVSIPVFDEAEKKFADWLGVEDALLVSSGTLAGRLMLEALGKEYRYHFGTNAHIAIRPSDSGYASNGFSCSIEDSIDSIQFSPNDQHVITFNSVDALTAKVAPIDWIGKLPNDKKVVLIIDDSHAIGILGYEGRGLYQQMMHKHKDTIMIASLGKAMGLPAGIIAGPAAYVSLARRHALFGGSSPMVPAYAFAYLKATDIYRDTLLKLKTNIRYFLSHLNSGIDFTYSDQFPVFCSDQSDIASYLDHHKIKISQFAYPSPKDKIYTRVIINALHTENDLSKLVHLLNSY